MEETPSSNRKDNGFSLESTPVTIHRFPLPAANPSSWKSCLAFSMSVIDAHLFTRDVG
jgi:hypothetical protein